MHDRGAVVVVAHGLAEFSLASGGLGLYPKAGVLFLFGILHRDRSAHRVIADCGPKNEFGILGRDDRGEEKDKAATPKPLADVPAFGLPK